MPYLLLKILLPLFARHMRDKQGKMNKFAISRKVSSASHKADLSKFAYFSTTKMDTSMILITTFFSHSISGKFMKNLCSLV